MRPTKTPRQTGAWCPRHGHYDPPTKAGQLLAIATDGRSRDQRARTLLEEASRLRSWCESCQGQAPSGPAWALAIRLAGPGRPVVLPAVAPPSPAGAPIPAQPAKTVTFAQTRPSGRWAVTRCRVCGGRLMDVDGLGTHPICEAA